MSNDCIHHQTIRGEFEELIMRTEETTIKEAPLPHGQGVSIESSRSVGQELLARPAAQRGRILRLRTGFQRRRRAVVSDGRLPADVWRVPSEGIPSVDAKKVDNRTPKGELGE